ncbi:MAG: potassium-transporting ATPase subunit KdpA [Pirellulaceae bacterium]|nr:potassium-transporting ATPase subunit KdpA [Pirellulaceae bacterium]
MTYTLPLLVLLAALALSWPLGRYITWAMEPKSPGTGRLIWEDLARRLLGSLVQENQRWAGYGRSLLLFNALMFLVVLAVLLLQGSLPLNPDQKTAVEPSLAFNTAASFATNTNLQHYSGEVSLSYLSQLTLMWLQFVSAATGIAALAALSRAMSGQRSVGNFYVDLWRATTLVLLPLAVVWAAFLAVSGVPMTFQGAAVVTTLEGAPQTIARGPVAAFVAIKQLGTNGGGFYGPNCAHPLENPTWWSNLANNLAVLLIPMAAVWMYGRITGRLKHAGVLFVVMFAMLVALAGLAVWLEQAPTAAFHDLPIAGSSNLEGKELRFGASAGPLWAVATTATSNGSVNAMHDSLNPLTGLLPMAGMWLNVIFGGAGVGMINMFLFIIVAVFLAGMMVGRTPEYLTRKIETKEMKLALIALLLHPLFILGGVAVFSVTSWGRETIQDAGSHGLSEIIYEFSSAAANNGSGFEGLSDNTVPWNIATGVIMLLARYLPILLPLAIAASLADKPSVSESAGTFRTDSWMFGLILAGTVIIVGALLFLPIAVLGPISEHLAGMATAVP